MNLTNNILLPKWITQQAIYAYFALLVATSVLFYHQIMNPIFMGIGAISVVGFFYYGHVLSRQWSNISSFVFEKKLWYYGLGIRITYVLLSYFFYQFMTGKPFEYGTADAEIYHICANDIAYQMANGNWHISQILDRAMGKHVELSDTGYPTYLAFVYMITGHSIFIARLLKAVLSTYSIVLIYRLANRHFGKEIGRLTGIVCLLMPNFIYYCGLHLKETEMLFLVVFYIEKADELIALRQFKIQNILPVALAAVALFTFRTVLGAVAVLALLTALVTSSSRVVNWGRRITLGLIAVSFIGIMMQSQFTEEINEIRNTDVRQVQYRNMEWRSQRDNGNSYAKYAGAAVFAPLIFTIPFPTMVNIPEQENLQIIHGGNFIKNILSIFTILAMFLLIINGEWRRHVFPLAFMLGYLVVLTFSNFAQSERFHIPALAFELMFASYAIVQIRASIKYRQWYTYWLILIFMVNLGWAYIKLKGRGI